MPARILARQAEHLKANIVLRIQALCVLGQKQWVCRYRSSHTEGACEFKFQWGGQEDLDPTGVTDMHVRHFVAESSWQPCELSFLLLTVKRKVQFKEVKRQAQPASLTELVASPVASQMRSSFLPSINQSPIYYLDEKNEKMVSRSLWDSAAVKTL